MSELNWQDVLYGEDSRYITIIPQVRYDAMSSKEQALVNAKNDIQVSPFITEGYQFLKLNMGRESKLNHY